MLYLNRRAIFDESITQLEYHTHTPYITTKFNNNDEVRILIQQQDVYTLPCESYLYVEGQLTAKGATGSGEEVVPSKEIGYLTNNSIAFLFSEIRYEIAGIEIDRVRKSGNPGIASTIKCYLSFSDTDTKYLANGGWSSDGIVTFIDDATGTFSFCVPLRILLGFAEDYKNIILNVKQELILLRSSSDNNAYRLIDRNKQLLVKLNRIAWKVPYVHVGNAERVQLLQILENDKPILMPYRSWELYEYPNLPTTQRLSWTVKTSSHMEKPRYVIVAFQTNRTNVGTVNCSQFDHCNITNIKLYLNSQFFPYDNLNISFKSGVYSMLYEMYAKFQSSYYANRDNRPLLGRTDFKAIAPLFVIDCSKQNETLKTNSVDVRLEIEASENIPTMTTAYCFILHDAVTEYTPLTGIVRRII